MATDWTAIRTEYINGAEYPDLAHKYKVKEATLRQRASRHKWSQERQKASQLVTAKATEALIETKAEQLAKFNADDLKVARNLRALVNRQIQKSNGEMDASTIRALAGAASEAQRIGRLALGAETESSVVMTKELPSSVDDFL